MVIHTDSALCTHFIALCLDAAIVSRSVTVPLGGHACFFWKELLTSAFALNSTKMPLNCKSEAYLS